MKLPIEELLPDGSTSPAQCRSINKSFSVLAVRYEMYSVDKDYTFVPFDAIQSLQVDASNIAVTITLSSPTGNRSRRIIKTDASANIVTIVGIINGSTNYALNLQYEFVEVEPTGTAWLIIGRGTLIPSVNGVTFPATQVPSTDPNTLDDYEEGTWTPSLGGNTTYTTQIGTYTKIGRLVTIHCRLKVNVLGTGSATTITGLPFTAANTASAIMAGTVPFWATAANTFVFLSCFVGTNTTSIFFTGATAATAAVTLLPNVFQDGADVLLSATYHV